MAWNSLLTDSGLAEGGSSASDSNDVVKLETPTDVLLKKSESF